MDDEFMKLIEEAIRLELNIAELYMLFYRQFDQDAQFWWQLVIEEENHAALLKTVQQMELTNVNTPRELFPERVGELEKVNLAIRETLVKFEKTPERERAFQFAYMIETSAGEMHFNAFMKNSMESRVTRIFKKLNGADLDHADRIKKYMASANIPFE
jgi:hypothetical protein